MSEEILSAAYPELTFRQRWASYLAIAVLVVGLAFGLTQRDRSLNATQFFESREFGISGRYPAGWLRAEPTRTVIFRVQDAAAIPFKTSMSIAVIPTTTQARPADILNDLTINRAAQFSTFRNLGNVPITLRNGAQGRQMTYAYAAVELNPFLQSEPTIVRAIDVVVLRGSQAIVISFESESGSFEQNRRLFDTFLASLNF